jgi:hypothetical protein
MAKQSKKTQMSILQNMGAQLVGRIPVSIKNKNKYLLVQGTQFIKENGYVNIGDTQNSLTQAQAILQAKGIEAINNLTDSDDGANLTLMVKADNCDFQKVEPEDLNVYGKEIGDDRINIPNLGFPMAPGEFEIPTTRKNDDPIFVQDTQLTENQKEAFKGLEASYNENTPDPVQVIELAVQVAASTVGCTDSTTTSPPGVVSKQPTSNLPSRQTRYPKL